MRIVCHVLKYLYCQNYDKRGKNYDKRIKNIQLVQYLR
jgi:hypothetical protein